MLYSYLINPTHASHRLSDVAARFSAHPLKETGDRELTEAAHVIETLTPILRDDVNALDGRKVYETIDLPLVPVLLRMEKIGVRIDSEVLNKMSACSASEIDRVGEEIFARSGHRFNIQSPKQLGDVLFNKMGLPKPLKYGKGKVVSTAQDVLEELAVHNDVPRMVLEYRQLAKLKSNYVDSLPLAGRQRRPRAYDLQPGGHGDRAAVVDQSESAEHSDPHGAGTRNSRRVHCCAGLPAACRRTIRRSSCG